MGICKSKRNKTTVQEAPDGMQNYILEFQHLSTIEELLKMLENPHIGELGYKCHTVSQAVILKKKKRKKAQDLIEALQFLQCLLELCTKLKNLYSASTTKLKHYYEQKNEQKNLEINALPARHANEIRHPWEKVIKAQKKKNVELEQKCMALSSDNDQMKREQVSSQQQMSKLMKQKNQLHEYDNIVHQEAPRLKDELDKTEQRSGRWIQKAWVGDQPRKEYSKQLYRSQQTNSVYDNTNNYQNQQLGNDGYTQQKTASYYHSQAADKTGTHYILCNNTGDSTERSSSDFQQSNVKNLENQIKRAQQKIFDLEEENKANVGKIKKVLRQKEQAIVDLECEQEKCEQIHRREGKGYQKTIDQQNSEIAYCRNKIHMLERDLHNTKCEVQYLKKQLPSIANTERGIQNAYQSEQKISDLTALCNHQDVQINTEKDKVARLTTQVGALSAEVDQLQLTLSQRENTISDLKQHQRKFDLTALCNEKDLQINAERDKVVRTQVGTLSSEVAQLQITLSQRENILSDLRQHQQQIEALHCDTDINRLHQDSEKMKDQIIQIRCQKAKLAEQATLIEQLQQDIQTGRRKLQQDNQRMEDKIRRREAEVAEQQARIEQLQQEVRNAQHGSHQKAEEIKELQNGRNRCQIDIERLKQDNERITLELQKALTQKEQAINDLQCEQEKCEQIHRREMNSHQKTINQKAEEIKQLQNGRNKSHADIKRLQQDNQRMKNNIGILEAKIAEQKARTEELQQELHMAQRKPSKRDRHRELEENKELLQRKETELQTVKRELGERNGQIQELSRKLAAEMSTKLASDESNVENVSIKNRPMNVAEEYQLLCSNQWLDAKTALDDLCDSSTPDYVKVQLLSDVIMVSETASTSMLQQIIEHFELMVFNPIKCVFQEGKIGPSSKTSSKKPKKGGHLSKELNNMYGDMLRTAADNIDISRLVKDIIHGLKNSNIRSPVLNTAIDTEEVHTYVMDTARICWKMVIQRPRMEFKRCDKWLGEKFQDLYWNSDNTPGAVVVQVYPMLYHGTSMMAKGKVLLIEQRKMVKF